MLRNVLGAIGGYVAMVVVALAGIGVAWMALGAAGAFAGEGPAPSAAWMVSNLTTGFIAALAGGIVARRIGTSAAAVHFLIGLVVVVGIASAFACGRILPGACQDAFAARVMARCRSQSA